MNVTDDEMVEDVVLRQATQWHVRHTEGELTADERDAFAEWLRRSPQHVRRYLELEELKHQLASVTAKLPELEAVEGNVISFGAPLPKPSKARSPARRAWRWPLKTAVAASVIGALALSYSLLYPHDGQVRETLIVPHGDQRTVSMDDGSIVHLNSQSTAHVRYSSQERLIELDKGQALFNVARDPVRPFRVRIEDTEVVAIGTQFDVYRKPDGITITVVEGRVEVSKGTAHPVQLGAGEQLYVPKDARVLKAEAVNVRMATAWIQREILFDQQRLEDVATEFNRYIATPIRLEDPVVRERRVSGIFNAYDAESFLEFLRNYNVEIERSGREILVRSREP